MWLRHVSSDLLAWQVPTVFSSSATEVERPENSCFRYDSYPKSTLAWTTKKKQIVYANEDEIEVLLQLGTVGMF